MGRRSIQNWKEVVTDAEESQVFVALDDPKFTWRTAGAIARQTGLNEDRVWEIVRRHTNLIRMSRTPSASGSPLVGLVSRVGE